jgi:hypothetical protein
MADQDVDKFFEETVERSLRDYAEEGVRDSDPAAITQHATSRPVARQEPQPGRISWVAVALGSAIALVLLLLLGFAVGVVKLPAI